MGRDPYGSRGSKSGIDVNEIKGIVVEILMDLVDLNFYKISSQIFILSVEILMDLVDLNPCMERQLFRR